MVDGEPGAISAAELADRWDRAAERVSTDGPGPASADVLAKDYEHLPDGRIRFEIPPDLNNYVYIELSETGGMSFELDGAPPLIPIRASDLPQVEAEWLLVQPARRDRDPKAGWVPVGSLYLDEICIGEMASDAEYNGLFDLPRMRGTVSLDFSTDPAESGLVGHVRIERVGDFTLIVTVEP